ncbi:MAG: putative selenate reductase subunit YgfK, partial [Candidatus Riflebacteria bacterium]
MSKEFSRTSIDHLASWILREYDETQQIFGIHKDLFFVPKKSDEFAMNRYGQYMETPIGVAAGPHTQMAQNLIAAWLCGSRYLELKTVQTLDELNVSKPCIDVQDEGYNCEWSQELRLNDSFDEYLNAWIMLHVLRHKFGWSKENGRGFIFNMSVGYNLEGVLKSNVQNFLDKMADCEDETA